MYIVLVTTRCICERGYAVRLGSGRIVIVAPPHSGTSAVVALPEIPPGPLGSWGACGSAHLPGLSAPRLPSTLRWSCRR